MIDQEAAKKHFVEGAERLGPTYKQATEYFNARPQTKAEIIRGIARVGATPQALYQRCVQLYPGVQIRYEVPLNFNLNVLTLISSAVSAIDFSLFMYHLIYGQFVFSILRKPILT